MAVPPDDAVHGDAPFRAAPVAEARRGWNSDFVHFESTHRSRILERLRLTYPESTGEERRSWGDTVPKLQREIGEVVRVDTHYARCTAVLEYELPMESRRADAVLLLREGVVVIELKGKLGPSDADIDQAHAYARDLRCYHRECHERPVHAVLVPTRMRGQQAMDRNVHVCGPDALDTPPASRSTYCRIREYIRRYGGRRDLEPPEHGVVFDEAQRAFDRARVADTHGHSLGDSRSEPQHFIEFAQRTRDWSVIVGLVGGGQEIHIGEEGGLRLWAEAIRGSLEPDRWTVHVPPAVANSFRGLRVETSAALTLDETLRSHRAVRLHTFVAKLLRKTPPPAGALRAIANELHDAGHDLRI